MVHVVYDTVFQLLNYTLKYLEMKYLFYVHHAQESVVQIETAWLSLYAGMLLTGLYINRLSVYLMVTITMSVQQQLN